MTPDNLADRQRIEIEYWRNSPTERPEAESVDNIVNKVSEAGIFLDLLQRFEADFSKSRRILELGAGQGWASCLVKRRYPDAHVVATDISEYAVASTHLWERIYGVRLDGASACLSYEIPADDASLDLVFCFAAAHHFGAHRRTFAELHRVLRGGGVVLYLYEPSCRPFLHGLAHARVNRKRPEVPEDVLIYPKMERMAGEAGFDASLHFHPSTRYRSPGATLYYAMLGRAPVLQRWLPCTVNYRFTKR
jgi:SAM-dependent methyltransferase